MMKPKILLMDEATANIDELTDTHIQRMIKEDFNNTTVLTIAHRIKTVVTYDRLLVLNKGKIAQYATPGELLDQEGVFSNIIMENGPEFYEELKKMVREKEEFF